MFNLICFCFFFCKYPSVGADSGSVGGCGVPVHRCSLYFLQEVLQEEQRQGNWRYEVQWHAHSELMFGHVFKPLLFPCLFIFSPHKRYTLSHSPTSDRERQRMIQIIPNSKIKATIFLSLLYFPWDEKDKDETVTWSIRISLCLPIHSVNTQPPALF